jgi:hypothetical protein
MLLISAVCFVLRTFLIFLSPQMIPDDETLFVVIDLCTSTEDHAMKAYWGSGGIAPCII